ncbi:flagellar hook-basal body protein [Halarcobacter bivalviorum]|uniref:flagellar hook-basal body protein n=1 Tax=Halarcobacter bivalviorum TaxID=663364 RepID=UPI00100BA33E|nr:flagellar hook-basal body protein [Halarcobacter bivalviorum]RXK05314.1 flagellar biosynthesis protein FlgG [Halarcobacter bivalviorum]
MAKYPLAASMINQINRIDMISNNLANVNTVGFKQEGTTEGSFNYYLQRAQQDGFNPTKLNEVVNTIPKMDTKYIHAEMGPIVSTGNALDFSLTQSDTFFKVRDEKSGDVVYTRDGSFKNLNGMLVDSNGQAVLSIDDEPIAIEAGEYFQGEIGVVKINYDDLEKYKDNNFKIKEAGINIEQLENNDGQFMQGSLEKSNVNSVSSMVALIDAHRRLEQAQKAIQSESEMNEVLVQKIGDTSK